MYFLNKRGDLGYITDDSSRAVRETFPQLNDKKFLKKHPDFLTQIEGFLRETAEIPGGYIERGKAQEIELGYIVPPGDKQPWTSSNFMIHKHVLKALRNDDEKPNTEGPGESPKIDPGASQYQSVCSVYKGFADLLYYKNAFGVCPYFPVLFKLPGYDLNSTARQEKAPLRVLNLRWNGNNDVVPAAEKCAQFPAVFSILRANLVKRGAIIRDDSKPVVVY